MLTDPIQRQLVSHKARHLNDRYWGAKPTLSHVCQFGLQSALETAETVRHTSLQIDGGCDGL